VHQIDKFVGNIIGPARQNPYGVDPPEANDGFFSRKKKIAVCSKKLKAFINTFE